MRIVIFICLCNLFVFTSCATFKNELNVVGGKNEIINNAIVDFYKTSSLIKKDKVFLVSFFEEIKNKESLVVRIGKFDSKLLFNSKNRFDKMVKLPTRYIEKEGKLFFWWDDNYPLKEDALETFERYNLLKDNKNGLIKILDFETNEKEKAVHYYFCKEKITIYKKVYTNKGLGYYEPPQLKCTSSRW